MPDTKFGLKQVARQTPQGISLLMDFLAGLCGIIAGFLTAANFIPHSYSDPISTILTALFIPTLLYIKRFFGAQITQTSVSIDKVAEIKETPKN